MTPLQRRVWSVAGRHHVRMEGVNVRAVKGNTPPLPGQEPSAAAEQKISFHRAFTFDVDSAVRLEPKSLVKVYLGCR